MTQPSQPPAAQPSRLDWPHVVIYGLMLGFTLALAFVAWKASDAVAGSTLWPVIGAAAGALVTAGIALFKSTSATREVKMMRAQAMMRAADTIPPTPRNDNGRAA